MSKNKTNDLSSFGVQEIELKAKNRILQIQEIKKKEISFLKKKNKHYFLNFKKRKNLRLELKLKLEKIKLEAGRRIIEIRKIEIKEIRNEETEKIKIYNKTFNDYIGAKNKNFDIFCDIEALNLEISKISRMIDENKKNIAKDPPSQDSPGWMSENCQNLLDVRLELYNRLKETRINKRKTQTFFNKNKKELNGFLNIFDEFFIDIVSENNELEKRDNFPSVIYCPYCGVEIDRTRLSNLLEASQKFFCPYCGIEIGANN